MNNSKIVCPHCGAENRRVEEAWINCMDENSSISCFNCKKNLYENDSQELSGEEQDGGQNFFIKFIIIFSLLSGLVIYLNQAFDVLRFKEDGAQIVVELLFIIFVSSTLASGKIVKNLKHLSIWGLIFLLFMVGYTYRYELREVKEKVMGELITTKGVRKSSDSISFSASSNGHFYIEAEVNGTPLIFMADTGATSIVLSPHDAEKIGIDIDELKFDRFYETANGRGRGSSIRIEDFRIGPIHMKNIRASVNEADMRGSLLGMTFFKRLKSYNVKNEVLTLKF